MLSSTLKFLLNTFTGNGRPLTDRKRLRLLAEMNHRYTHEGWIAFPENVDTYLKVTLQNGLKVYFYRNQYNQLNDRFIGTMNLGEGITSVCYHPDGKLDVLNNIPLLKTLGRKEEDFTELEQLRFYYSIREITDFK